MKDTKFKKWQKVVSVLLLVVVILVVSPLGRLVYAATASALGVWQTSNKFTITENGTYTVYVKDAVGNISQGYSFTVNTIDNEPPTLSVGYSTTSWTNGNVSLVIDSVDQASPGGTAGTVSLSVVGSNGATYPTNHQFTENISGTVKATDDVGNSTSKPFSITWIDKSKPNAGISADITSPTNGNVVLTLSGSDGQSGLHSKPFSWDNTNWTATASKTFTENGTYVGYIRDVVGNVNSVQYVVSNIDRANPVINGFSFSEENPTNTDVVVTASAVDVGLGLHDSAYSFNGQAWQSSPDFTVTTNGSYSLVVRDKAGNTSESSFVVSNIDKDAPVIHWVTPNTIDPTNQDVTFDVGASDNEGGLGLSDTPYKIDGVCDWQASNQLTVVQNGTYTIKVRDKAGNVASVNREVANIDKTLPSISASADTTDPVNRDVVITINASDNVEIAKVLDMNGNELLGIGSISNKTYEFTVADNGTYSFVVVDTASNQSSVDITVSNIDKQYPIINGVVKNPDDPINSTVEIIVNASDVGLGLAGEAYNFNNEGWITSNSYVVSANGDYSLAVRDKAGNTVNQVVRVTNLDFDNPVINSITQDIDAPTNTDVVLSVDAEDVGLGLESEAYKLGDGSWQSSNKFTVTENGTYTIYVIDDAGNMVSQVKDVTNIDKTLPSISASADTTDPVNRDVVVELTVSDNVEIARVLDTDGNELSGVGTASAKTYTESIESNGTYTYTVIDTASNESSVQVVVANIDKVSPYITNIVKNPDDPINSTVEITVVAGDDGLGLHDEPYSFDGGAWQSDGVLVVNTNGSYSVSVRDKAGNTVTRDYVVSNLDFDNPVINDVTQDIVNPTNTDVVLIVDAEDIGLGLEASAYKLGDGSYQVSNEFTVTENGTYVITVIDDAGNTVTFSKTVTNIDKTLPTISASVDTTVEVNRDIVVELVAWDNVEIAKVLDNDGNELTGTGSLTDKTYTAYIPENGTYVYTVVDTADNKAEVSVTVENIDKSEPVVDSIVRNPGYATNDEVGVTVIVHDVGLGLADEPYSFDGGAWSTENSKVYDENGTYKVSIKDKAGNILVKEFTVSNLDFDSPVINAIVKDIYEQTNTDIVLTVVSEDIGLGLDETAYKFGDGDWQKFSSTTVSENGTYSVKVRDLAGNESYSSIVVENIDKVMPVVSHSVSVEPDAPTVNDVVITLSAEDNVEIKSITLPDGVLKPINDADSILTFTVSENGDYTFLVEDTAGNVVEYIVTVPNIDKEPATIVATPSETDWTSSDFEVLVEYTDNYHIRKVMLDSAWYDLDAGVKPDGAELLVEDGFVKGVTVTRPVTDNGVLEFRVIDYAGLETEHTLEIENIDRVSPTLEYELSQDVPTNLDITVSLEGLDDYGDVKSITLPDETIFEGSVTEFVVTEDGVYDFKVTDEAGNESDLRVEIYLIDKVEPTVELELVSEDWTSDVAIINVIAEDRNARFSYELVDEEGNSIESEEGRFEVSENGTYLVRVMDGVGNIAEKSIIVGNVDSDSPTISVTLRDTLWVNRSNALIVTSADNQSGVSGYSLDGANWQTSGVFEVSYADSYTVYVKDSAGNVASLDVSFELVEPTPEPTQEPVVEEQIEVEEPAEEVVTVVDTEIQARTDILADGNLRIVTELVDLPVAASHGITVVDRVIEKVIEVAEDVAEVAVVVAPYAGIAVILSLGVVVFILMTDGVRVYGRDKKNKWKYLGIARCRKGISGYTVRVNRKVLKSVDGCDFKLVFGTKYSTTHKGSDLAIKLGNQSVEGNIYKNVEFSIAR